jgi:hypothetical protein
MSLYYGFAFYGTLILIVGIENASLLSFTKWRGPSAAAVLLVDLTNTTPAFGDAGPGAFEFELWGDERHGTHTLTPFLTSFHSGIHKFLLERGGEWDTCPNQARTQHR